MYIRPFTTSRMITVRLPPPRLPGGISGSTNPHSSSVRSLGYRNLLRSYRPRFLLVHIGDPSSNQATTLESQMIHMIQELFEQTLRVALIGNGDKPAKREKNGVKFERTLKCEVARKAERFIPTLVALDRIVVASTGENESDKRHHRGR